MINRMQVESQTGLSFVGEEVHSQNVRAWMLPGILLLIFLLAAALRVYRLPEQPGVLLDRDYTSAIIARDFFFRQSDDVTPWRKEMAYLLNESRPLLEPPVTEFLVSLLYRAAGGEHIWLARMVTSLFWLIGGVFLYKLAKMVVRTEAAVFATIYYLFVPSGILISRSFQPDSLMMLTFLASLFGILKYYQQPSWTKLAVTASITGLTLVHRPLVLFVLFAAFVALGIAQRGIWKSLFHRQAVVFFFIGLLPTALYYGYGIFVADFFRWKVETSFRPSLLLHWRFWMGWLNGLLEVVGLTGLVGALVGMPVIRRGLARALLGGLGIGYVMFGLLFTVHIHTHSYYNAQLIPIIAMPLGATVAIFARWLRAKWKGNWWLPTLGIFALAIYSSFQEVRGGLGKQVFESEAVAKEIGDLVRHSSRVVFVSPYYGLPLQYNGELSGQPWPRPMTYRLYKDPYQHQTVKDRLQVLRYSHDVESLGFHPEYFVITDFKEYSSHHTDLKEYLTTSCSLLAETPKYLIYHLCKSAD
jgi:4-amino-4-deoxy-L-arabinose transferase-like glycosyltransferase